MLEASAGTLSARRISPRIVHVTSAHPPFDVRIFRKMCRSLASAGADVTLIAPGATDVVLDGVRMVGLRPARTRIGRMLGTVWGAFREALRRPAEVYHFHDPELLPACQLLRLMGRCVVFDMHEFLPGALRHKPWIPRPLRGLASLAWRYIERVLLAGVPVIFAERSYAREYAWVRRSAVIMNFADLNALLRVERP